MGSSEESSPKQANVIRSRAILHRLNRLQHEGEQEPELVRDQSVLSSDERARLPQVAGRLIRLYGHKAEACKKEFEALEEELNGIIWKCPLVDSREIRRDSLPFFILFRNFNSEEECNCDFDPFDPRHIGGFISFLTNAANAPPSAAIVQECAALMSQICVRC